MRARTSKALIVVILAGVIAPTALLPVLPAFAAQLAPTVTTVSATDITLKQAMLNATVNPNEEQTVAWFEYGPSTSFGVGTEIQFAGSQSYIQSLRVRLTTLEPGTTYYFRIVAQNKYGTSYGNTMSFTTAGGQPNTNPPAGNYTPPVYYPPPSYNPPSYSYSGMPAVTTLSASAVSQTSAGLNGTVYPSGSATNAWFEWGATSALGNSTAAVSISNTATYSSYSQTLATLSPNTAYYYRAVAQNAQGTVHGQIISFTTHTSGASAGTVATNSGAPPSGIGAIFKSTSAPKPVDPGALNLSSALSRTQPWPGAKIEYTVNYTNTGVGTLSALSATVELPPEVQYISSDIALREQNGNVLTFDLPSLKGRKDSSFVIAGVVKESAEIGSSLIFNATMDYTDALAKRHSKETSVSAVVIAANKAPSLLALAFGGASGSVAQWLLMVTAFLAALAIYNGIRRAISGFSDERKI
ncbi:MAG: hypothetical protein HYT22_03820 [Candidatus Niyogibacteria bacterium]|nr:hypothetical protein [Candidatus Niyogibacteria bacterium]